MSFAAVTLVRTVGANSTAWEMLACDATPPASTINDGPLRVGRAQGTSGRSSITSMGASATMASKGYRASLALELGLPGGRDAAKLSNGAFGTKGAGHLELRSSNCPLTESTRIVSLVLQSFKTTIVNSA